MLHHENSRVKNSCIGAFTRLGYEYIVKPKVILCLGRSTFEGVLSAFDAVLPTRIMDYNSFIESPNNPVTITLENGEKAYVFALAHCGAMGTLNRND